MNQHIFSRWNPMKIPGCALWLEADRGITLDGSNNVSAWADQSGNGRHAARATEAYRPAWVTNQLNGWPAVISDGVNDSLVYPHDGSTYLTEECTVFSIHKLISGLSSTQDYYAYVLGTTDLNDHVRRSILSEQNGTYSGNSDDICDIASGYFNDRRASLTGISALDVWNMYTVCCPADPDDLFVYANGVEASMTTMGLTKTSIHIPFAYEIGAAFTNYGANKSKSAHTVFIVWPRVLLQSELNVLHSHYSHKYGLLFAA
jgi:hypothetical protein